MSAPICMTELTVTWQDDSSTVCFLSLSFSLSLRLISFFPTFLILLWILYIFILSSTAGFSSYLSIPLFSFALMDLYIDVAPSWSSSSSSSFRQRVSDWPHTSQSSRISPCPLHHWVLPSLFFFLLYLCRRCRPAFCPKLTWAKTTDSLTRMPPAPRMYFVLRDWHLPRSWRKSTALVKATSHSAPLPQWLSAHLSACHGVPVWSEQWHSLGCGWVLPQR